MDLVKKSKYMSKLLRHDPDGLKIDKAGYVDVNDLCDKVGIDLETLNTIVELNDKKRFSFNEDKTRIRAVQGHSKGVAVETQMIEITAVQQTFVMYHGTSESAWDKIKTEGIKPGTRNHVHWTISLPVAEKRARQMSQYSGGVVITLDAKTYLDSGGRIYIAENGVHLTDAIRPEFLKTM
jgi:putative RNA 2'-phosphotransferase